MDNYMIINTNSYDPENNELDNNIKELLKSNMSIIDILKFKQKIACIITNNENISYNNTSDNKTLKDIKKSLKDIKEIVNDIPSKKKIKKLSNDFNDSVTEHMINCCSLLGYILTKYGYNYPHQDIQKLPEEFRNEFKNDLLKIDNLYTNKSFISNNNQPIIDV